MQITGLKTALEIPNNTVLLTTAQRRNGLILVVMLYYDTDSCQCEVEEKYPLSQPIDIGPLAERQKDILTRRGIQY